MKRLFFIFLLFLMLVAIIALAYPDWVSKYYPRWFSPTPEKNYLTLYGNVDIRQVDLGFRIGGRVKSMPFEEGDFVSAGVLMAELDSEPYEDQVKQADAHVESIKASIKDARRLLDRRKLLFGTGGISPQDIDDAQTSLEVFEANLREAQAARGIVFTNLKDTKLYAPADGTILTRIREPGTVVRDSDPIYTLSLISPIWVRTYVSEPQLGQIYPGMLAKIYTDTSGGHVYQGHVGFISPVAEFTPKTVQTTQLRTDLVYRLRVIANNPDHGLRQGMPVTVQLFLPDSETSSPPLNKDGK